MRDVFKDYILGPSPENPSLTEVVTGQDQEGKKNHNICCCGTPIDHFPE